MGWDEWLHAPGACRVARPMSIVDQSEIDALLAEARDLAATAGTEPAGVGVDAATVGRGADTGPGAAVRGRDAGPPLPGADDPRIARLLRIRVPVIVQLAERQMPIALVRNLSVGAIIEFDKSVDEALDLRINNRLIGHGTCVKVGENFGLRITRIVDRPSRVRSLAAG